MVLFLFSTELKTKARATALSYIPSTFLSLILRHILMNHYSCLGLARNFNHPASASYSTRITGVCPMPC